MSRLTSFSLLAAAVVPAAWSGPAVRLLANLPSPQPVGTIVGLTTLVA